MIEDVKLIDFGNAFYDTFDDAVSFYDDFQLQSPLYRAPEIFFGVAGFDAAIDVWSLGAILAEFFLGAPLFVGETAEEILGAVVGVLGPLPKDYFRKGAYFDKHSRFADGKPDRHGDVVERLCNVMGTRDRTFVDFVARCLAPTPAKRMTPAQAASHPFLAPVCPVAFLSEPRFDRSSDGIPYVDADLPRDYDYRPMKPADARNADPTFVRSLDYERVALSRSGRVLIGATEAGAVASPLPRNDILTTKPTPMTTASSAPRSAGEILAELEKEERRLDEAEKNQEALKRKASALEQIPLPSPAKAANKIDDCDSDVR